ncbi:MAG TPA: SMC-Scp complex subunit ScpB [Candidatus Wallbacteria bacterium]|nr:SMC-Scp complex subunit ScpB [Candidatus Wallbacteria bacterium]
MKHEHSIIEALLFVSQNSLQSSKIAEILKVETKEASRLIDEYGELLKAKNSALCLIKSPDGYRLGTRHEYSHYIEMLIAPRETKLSYQALETLSIVAFKQHITKQEMEKVRGINSDGIINTLCARGLIKVVGVKKLPGNPKIYGISKEFFKYFGIKSLGELKAYLKSIEVDTSRIDALLKEEDAASNIFFEDPNQESFDFGEESGERIDVPVSDDDEPSENSESPENSENIIEAEILDN